MQPVDSSLKTNKQRERYTLATRRKFLYVGIVALLYPLLRFIGYNVPRKPKRIEINSPVPGSGVLANNEFLLFDRDENSWAVSRRCTHLGCKITFHEEGNYLECPCHQSRFTPQGEVIRGPAKEKLTVYSVEKRNTPPYYVVTI